MFPSPAVGVVGNESVCAPSTGQINQRDAIAQITVLGSQVDVLREVNFSVDVQIVRPCRFDIKVESTVSALLIVTEPGTSTIALSVTVSDRQFRRCPRQSRSRQGSGRGQCRRQARWKQ